MTDRKSDSLSFSDLERSHPVVADSVDDTPENEPLAVRLGELWSDFIRIADEARDPELVGRTGGESNSGAKAAHAIPLIDDMKGILQWD